MRRVIVACSAFALLVGMVGLTAGASAASRSTAAKAKVNPYGGLDCNGFSPIQKPMKLLQCTDIRSLDEGKGFEDNGHYTGHDEPMNQFFSTVPGSGNSMQYTFRLPEDPAGAADGSFTGNIHDFMLEIAPWFSMVLCDTQSWPEADNQTCTPDSDANIQVPPQPDHAPTAFMEVQFYPPGYPPNPFINAISCDETHWCSALTIDSLQLNFDFSVGNGNCIEPVNFALVSHDGVPAGPPGPDQWQLSTFTPTADTLLMNPGDLMRIRVHDTDAGVRVDEKDLTTGESGRMVASVANGFRQIVWDDQNFTCNGQPYAFHPMYDTAAPPEPNGQPTAWAAWSAHTGNISFSSEIGHFEAPDGDKDDAGCFPGPPEGCLGTDGDFDGYGYHLNPAGWPDGSSRTPTMFAYTAPKSLDPGGQYSQAYESYRFETDIPGIEGAHGNCNIFTGQNCHYPPRQHRFYPWFHKLPDIKGGRCGWGLGNDVPGQLDSYGGMNQAWGSLETTDYGGGFVAAENFATDVLPNTCP